MYRRPFDGDARGHLTNDQFEFAQAYLTRTRRVLFLRGTIASGADRMDVFSTASIGDDIMAMNHEDPRSPIYLFIDSPGGDVAAGLIFYDIIRLSTAPIITIGVNCASMATIILCAGHERLLMPHSRLMLHLPTSGFQGDSEEFKSRSDLLQKIKNELVGLYIDRGVTANLKKDAGQVAVRKQILKDIDRPLWLDTAASITYGLADRIVAAEDLFGATT